MQKLIGFGLIALGLYLGYDIYFEYHRFDDSNAAAEHAESYAADVGNYAAASYFRGSHTGPSWVKMILFGVGSLACLLLGAGLTSENKGPKAG